MPEKNTTTFDVLIEIPKGSRNKYEYDFELKKIRFDRMLFSSMMYRSEEHTSELQSPVPISYAVFCLKKKKNTNTN